MHTLPYDYCLVVLPYRKYLALIFYSVNRLFSFAPNQQQKNYHHSIQDTINLVRD